MAGLAQIGPVVREEDFLISSMYFRYFVIISPLKRAGTFIWTNLNSLHPRMHCAKFGRKWLSASGEEDFLCFVNVFSPFRNYLPFEKGGALYLNKSESPSSEEALCQVWSKLTQRFWRRRFFNLVNEVSPFRNYLPFEKGGALYLNKIKFPSSKDALCQFGRNWLSGSREDFFLFCWCIFAFS